MNILLIFLGNLVCFYVGAVRSAYQQLLAEEAELEEVQG